MEPRLYIASAPRLAEDVASSGAGFPSRHPRESASKAFGHPQTDRTPFFAVTFRRAICGPLGWHWWRRGYAWLKARQRPAACVVLARTADGFDKETAVSRAQLALDDYIKQYKAENHLSAVTVSAMRAERSLIGEAG